MKKIYLLNFLILVSTGLFAQQVNSGFPVTDLRVPTNSKIGYALPDIGGSEFVPLGSAKSFANYSSNLKPAQTIIGATTYDLQTNASVARRLYNEGGDMAGIWTFSLSGDLGAPDRGTGYNYDSGLGWGALPTARIETTRQGWPSLGIGAAGNEHVISHQFTTDVRLITRPTAGSGTWTESSIPALAGQVHAWPRFAMGGANGNSIHLIDITLPSANGGTAINGIDGLVTYTRSPDNGATWDIQHVTLPGVDSTLYLGFGADSYHIDADGDNVAIVTGRIDTDLSIWKSTDNGTTWTKTVVMQFPLPGYNDATSITDINNDGIADTVLTNDGKNCVLIDDNGMVHVWAGSMFIYDGVISDPLSLFLSTDGLLYWNEGMGANPPVVIATSPDRDGDGMLSYAVDYVPRYGNGGATTQPSAGIDAAGNIYVSYVTLMENTSTGNPAPGDFSYRNTFIMATQDGGMTWNPPFNASDSDFDEAVFASVARNVQGACVDIIWQQDGLPGIAVQAPDGNQALHPFGNNDIVHECVDMVNVLGINDISYNEIEFSLYPNPASDLINVSITDEVDVFDVNIYNNIGQLVYSSANQTRSKANILSIDVAALNSGMYMLTVISENRISSKKIMIN